MDDGMKLMWTKIGVLVILFSTTIGVGSIPFCIFTSPSRASTPSRIFSILNCFAGGIFLGLCLLDLFPDVIETFEGALDKDVEFPFAELSVACGLLLVLVLEQMIHALQALLRPKIEDKEERAPLPSNPRHSTNFGTFNESASGQVEQERQSLLTADEEPDNPSPRHNYGNRSTSASQEDTTTQVNHVDQDPNHAHDVTTAHTHDQIGDGHVMHTPSVFRSLLLLGALCFHSILEGFAVGILSTTNEVWTFLLGIAIHKSVISFSLGINFLTTMKKLNAFLCQVMFAVMSPIGITIGMVVVSEVDKFSSSIWQGILQGVATGTFLYVTFFELLPGEIQSPRDIIWKVISILVGFGVVAGLVSYEDFYE